MLRPLASVSTVGAASAGAASGPRRRVGQRRIEQRRGGGARRGGRTRVPVHPRRDRRPVVKQRKLPGQALGRGHARGLPEFDEQRPYPGTELVGDLLDGAAGAGLRTGVHKRAAAETRLRERLAEHVENPQKAIPGRLVARERPGDALLPGRVPGGEIAPDELVLAAEDAVEGGLGHPGTRDYPVDADGVHALFVKQLVGGGQQPLAGRPPIRGRGGHGLTITDRSV